MGDGEAGVQGREERDKEGPEVRDPAQECVRDWGAHVAEPGGEDEPQDGREDQVLPLPRLDRAEEGAVQDAAERERNLLRQDAIRAGHDDEGHCLGGQEVRAQNDWHQAAEHAAVIPPSPPVGPDIKKKINRAAKRERKNCFHFCHYDFSSFFFFFFYKLGSLPLLFFLSI
ncbi:unnamed protein product [Linum tenue]|uniref:Uncharacterized protein n=1 Tax=Linum tenue TaxID=586396 RepID=A0AAV0QPL1_9ROSI|nr:unnamed protein product [Linum tenue]